MSVNYRQIPALLAKREPFEGNSMKATLSPEGIYLVWSYETVIAAADGDEISINDTHYSTTTSRHQGLVRAWLR